MFKKKYWISFLAIICLVGMVQFLWSLSLTDIPVDSAFPYYKMVIQPANNTLLETEATEVDTDLALKMDKLEAPTALNVTNGQEISISTVLTKYVLNGIGGANDTTNTITLANTTVGNQVVFLIAAASSNLIQLADSGNLNLTSAFIGDNFDSISLIAQATNDWVEISRSDN